MLNPQEKDTLQHLSQQVDLPGQRARALLAIAEGTSQTEAGARSGLSLGQVKYALRKFRQVGLAFFSVEALTPEVLPTPASTPTPITVAADEREDDSVQTVLEAVIETRKKQKKRKKGKKKSGKKGKKSKLEKSTDKTKKSKKTKSKKGKKGKKGKKAKADQGVKLKKKKRKK